MSYRKSCLMLPPYFAPASLRRMLKTMALGSSMEMPSLKTPVSLSDMLPTAAPQECPGDFLQSSIQLPLLCFAVMTQVFSRSPMSIGFHFQKSRYQCRLACRMRPNSTKPASFPGFEQLVQLSLAIRNCVPMPNAAGWHRFGARSDSMAATMMKTEAARVPGSSATPQAAHSRSD